MTGFLCLFDKKEMPQVVRNVKAGHNCLSRDLHGGDFSIPALGSEGKCKGVPGTEDSRDLEAIPPVLPKPSM